MLRRLMTVLIVLVSTLPWAGAVSARPARSGPTPGGAPLRTFSGGGISFSYPASWHAYQFPWASSLSTSLAYVSNVPLHRPCVGRPIGPGCQGPVSALPAGGVLLVWTENGFPGWTFGRARGALLRINGRPARLQVLPPQPAWCPLNTSQMLDVVIARPEARDNWYELRACLAGPHLHRTRGEVMAVLYSFRATR